MRPEERDAAYLWDMLNAAREAHMTVEDTTCDTFMEVSGEENAALIPHFSISNLGRGGGNSAEVAIRASGAMAEFVYQADTRICLKT